MNDAFVFFLNFCFQIGWGSAANMATSKQPYRLLENIDSSSSSTTITTTTTTTRLVLPLSFYTFIVFAICLIVVFMFLMSNVSQLSFPNDGGDRIVFPVEQAKFAQQNCDLETVYSMTDDDCNEYCRPPGKYVSRVGRCINALNFTTSTPEVDRCDPKLGVVSYIIGDPQFGETKVTCLSVDPGIQPDNVDKPNKLCVGGELSTNYLDTFPQLENCVCPDDHFLGVIRETSAIRTHGVCIRNDLRPMYALNNLEYQRPKRPVSMNLRSSNLRAESPDINRLEDTLNLDGRLLTA